MVPEMCKTFDIRSILEGYNCRDETDLGCCAHDLRHLGAQLVAAGDVGCEVRGGAYLGLRGGFQELVELQDLFLNGVEVT